MKLDLFATPLWIYDFDDAEELNRYFLNIAPNFKFGQNYFDLPGEPVAKLKQKVLEYVKDISVEYKWLDTPKEIYGRQHPIQPKESDSPHFHPFAKMIGVYYVQALPNCGDILFFDSRGGTFWPDPKAVINEERMARIYHRVTPKPGRLLLFPNYLEHMVETNLSNSVRISIAMELYDFPPHILQLKHN
jgi:uncharacterized protein (TIGR02466 family)